MASGGNVVNEIRREYNGLGQLTNEYQSNTGAVNTGTTPRVQYAYSEMSGGTNHSRLTSMTYPNGRALNYNYTASTGIAGIDDRISRLSSISDTSATLESLTYLGLGTVVKRAHTQPGADLTYIKLTGESNGDSQDQYAGLDRFNRVANQRWMNSVSSGTVDRFGYAHDRNSNRLYKENLLDTTKSELYAYDGLDRLTNMQRGTLNGSKTGLIGSATRSQNWSLDALGNPNSVTTDGSAETRTHNKQNQLTGMGASTLAFDANGNVTTDQTGTTFVYDAWNRLVEAKNGPVSLIRYEHDGVGRRVEEGSTTLYYSSQWQVIEERESGVAVVQRVWSPVYVDAAVTIDRDSDANGTYDERSYVLQDANFNVTALANASGIVIERYLYDAYGKRTVLDASWTLDANGISNVLNRQGHQGGLIDRVIGYHVNFRNRILDVDAMRWTQQDPAEYINGMNMYNTLGSNPAGRLDPWGLAWWNWIPVVSTIGNAFSDPAGRDAGDYNQNAQPSAKDCKDNREFAIQQCKDSLRGDFIKFLGDWLGAPLAADATKTVAAIVAGAVATWSIRVGARGAVGGAVTGGVLLGDAAIDATIVIKKANDIGNGHDAAVAKLCICPEQACAANNNHHA